MLGTSIVYWCMWTSVLLVDAWIVGCTVVWTTAWSQTCHASKWKHRKSWRRTMRSSCQQGQYNSRDGQKWVWWEDEETCGNTNIQELNKDPTKMQEAKVLKILRKLKTERAVTGIEYEVMRPSASQWKNPSWLSGDVYSRIQQWKKQAYQETA